MPENSAPGRDYSTAGRAVESTIKGVKITARGGQRAGRWVARNVGVARSRGGAGEIGMMRLLDLHALSCAGDTLVTMGLAGTVFFSVPTGEARGRVALYLLITMAPFALLAPVIGPLLDRFRHGRRYALALTMVGRAVLAWMISDHLSGIVLYPLAFGVLALSRAYGVARSAAVPRLLPPGLGLSEAGARASVFGTIAGAVVAPIGIAAIWIGHPWPLRIAAFVFICGMVVALRLPAKADSEAPEQLPRIFLLPNRESVKVLSGRLVVAALFNGAILRALYGFLTLFLAFSIKSGGLNTSLLGMHPSPTKALAYAVGGLGLGTFVATAIGSRVTIHRPTLVQAVGLAVVAVIGLIALIGYDLGLIILLCIATAIVSGLAKLSVDASIQERINEDVRASAFAHSETLLMLAFVAGGAVGLIPFPGQVGIGVAAAAMIVAALRSGIVAVAMRGERLVGEASSNDRTVPLGPESGNGTAANGAAAAGAGGSRDGERVYLPASGTPGSPTGHDANPPHGDGPGGDGRTVPMAPPQPTSPWPSAANAGSTHSGGLAPTKVEPGPAARASAATRPPTPKASRWRRFFGVDDRTVPVSAPSAPAPTKVLPRSDEDQPGYHLYRPSSGGQDAS